MATISEVRDGIKTALSTISGLRVHDTVPDSINPPAAIVLPERGVPRTVTGTRDTQEYRIQLIVGAVNERGAQDLLDTYLSSTGSSSIRAAIAANQTLGVSVKAIWMGWENYGVVEWSDRVRYLGVDVLISVHT